jgi:hypothetical protein
MAALHGKEDPLLDPERFGRFLRQANDAEIADVRVIAEDQFELSPHKTDIAMQRRTPAAAAEGAGEAADGTAPSTPRTPALRYRSGARTGAKRSEVSMVGVINLDEPEPETAAPAVVGSTAAAPASAAEDSAPSASPTAAKKKSAKKASSRKKAASGNTAKKAAKASAGEPKTAKTTKAAKPAKKSAKSTKSAKNSKTPAG